MKAFRKDMDWAAARFHSSPGQMIETRFGALEYAQTGAGPDVLFSHGVLGSYLDGIHAVGLWIGSDVHAIVPSRFGYFGSDLPKAATAASQADSYVDLLDHLGIPNVVAVGFSAGGPSVIELALRHPDRVLALVLSSCRLPGLPKPKQALKPILRFVFGADRLFWIYKHVMPKTYALTMGIPKTYAMSTEDHASFDPIADSFFPLQPRRKGAMFDSFVSNPGVDDAPLEDISVPTLIVHSADDPLAPYYSAEGAAARIPGARFVTIPNGGHLFLGHDEEVREEIHSFIHRPIVPELVSI